MLPEKTLERTFRTAFAALPALSGDQIVCSRDASIEDSETAPTTIAIALGVRGYDSFSLPTANITGNVTVATRVDLDPSGTHHDAVIEALADWFSSMHVDGASFSAAFTTPTFYATELRMDGGTAKTNDGDRFTESISFTIRGTFNF